MLDRIKNQEKLQDTLLKDKYHKYNGGTFGTIVGYDINTNTATVVIEKQETNHIDQILYGVPCPTYIGVQMVAPEPGRPCWVVFKNGDVSVPLVTHYYNHMYHTYDHKKQTSTDSTIPSFLLRR